MIDHKFKKKFGQNFLQDENIINKIANVCETTNDDLIIETTYGKFTYKIYEFSIEWKDF